MGAAVAAHPARIGIQDLQAHRISWLCGYTFVGDGAVLGIADTVYFQPAGSAALLAEGPGGALMIPILGSDDYIGQTYVDDIVKHYARRRIRKLKLRLISLNPSTANAMMVYVGPVRGAGASGDTVLAGGFVSAGATLANVLAMAGAISLASYESKELDITSFVAGGSAGAQNEFANSRNGDDASATWGLGSSDLTGITPAAFVVAGTNATAALRGTRVHMIVVEQTVDLLDFLGGQNLVFPEGFALRKTREEFEARLKRENPGLYEQYQKARGTLFCRK
jgi:hypothetical protein